MKDTNPDLPGDRWLDDPAFSDPDWPGPYKSQAADIIPELGWQPGSRN